jgi:predicted Zn-dependent peptidase
METPQDVASKVWDLMFHDLPLDWYDSYFSAVDGFADAQIQAFARKWVDPKKLKIVVVGREDEVRPDLEKIAPVTVIKPGEKVPPTKKDVTPPA